ncbi:hypothetical protein PLESTM_001687300 [Pleodorina starrii]|nr:hypothetical protein PLESTM_001687300 [Pleodorina starrii]
MWWKGKRDRHLWKRSSPSTKADSGLLDRRVMLPVFQVPIYVHLVCNGCSVMLQYPMGAQSVKCSVCHTVTPVTAATMGAASAGAAPAGPSGSQQPQRPKPTQTVVVENPPSYDDKGNEVANIAVGVKADS